MCWGCLATVTVTPDIPDQDASFAVAVLCWIQGSETGTTSNDAGMFLISF